MTGLTGPTVRCVRCPRAIITPRVWPDGPVCGRCYHVARRRTGTCADCGNRGLVPGQRGDQRLCPPCAGIADIVCETCAAVNTAMHDLRICHRCRIRQQVATRICDGVEPCGMAGALIDVLCERNPFGLTRWLARNPDVVAELHDVATGQRDLAHARLDTFRPSQVEHLRRQLVVAGLLPERDHHLGLFDRWSATFLASIDNPTHHHLIATYTTWHVRRHVTTAIETGTFRGSSTRCARRHIRVALVFLQWLDDRHRTLADCQQADIDHWFATGNTNRRSATGFITWARTQRLCRRGLDVPVYRPATPNGMPHNQRVELVARLLHDNTIPLDDRVAGLLVAVYAQPVTRVCRLPATSITCDAGGPTRVRLGNDDIELAEPIAQLVAAHLNDPARPHSPWLFPGRTPGQPCSAHALAQRLHTHGVTRAARIAALHDLVQQIPSPVLAGLIAYNPHVIANRAAALAAPWNHYAALRTR